MITVMIYPTCGCSLWGLGLFLLGYSATMSNNTHKYIFVLKQLLFIFKVKDYSFDLILPN